jgi:glycosyltransferase involved in cell wall biosynthesis
MIELARLRPDIRVRLQWRAWGSAALRMKALARLSPPPNLEVVADAKDMAEVYRSAHATICCYEAGFGKSCPNSIVEGLACGRPALVTDTCDIADVVAGTGAGVVTPRSAVALASAIDELQRDWASYALQARRAAEKLFNFEDMAETYRTFYCRLSRNGGRHS